MDGGIDTYKAYNRGFNGPFVTFSIGLGRVRKIVPWTLSSEAECTGKFIAMADITFRAAWRRNDPEIVRDAKACWHRLGVMMSPEEFGGERTRSELCGVAYADGKLIAVSSALPYLYPRLRARFAFYRSMVAPEFRRQNRASASIRATCSQIGRSSIPKRS